MPGIDRIEFYHYPDVTMIASVDSSMRIEVGQHVSIRGKPWTARKVTFALDYADDYSQRALRCNVELEQY